MASSIAPSTILRSIAFSLATASAICKSSSLLALTVAIRQSPLGLTHLLVAIQRGVVFAFGSIAALASAQRFRNQRVGQNEPGFRHLVDRQQYVGAVTRAFDADTGAIAVGTQ